MMSWDWLPDENFTKTNFVFLIDIQKTCLLNIYGKRSILEHVNILLETIILQIIKEKLNDENKLKEMKS